MKPFRERAGLAVSVSLGLFGLLVPITIAGANISWGLLLASLLAYAYSGGGVDLGARRSVLEKPLWAYCACAVLAAVLGTDPSNSLSQLPRDLHKVWLYTLFAVAFAANPAPKLAAWVAGGFAFAALAGVGQSLFSWSGAPLAHAFVHPLVFGEPLAAALAAVPVPGLAAWMIDRFASAALAGVGQVCWSWTAGVNLELARARAFVHPVAFGEQMAVGLIGAASFLVAVPGGFKKQAVRVAGWILLALTGAALVLSDTRGAMLGCVAGLAALCLLMPGRRRGRALVLLAVFAVSVGVVSVTRDRGDLLSRFWSQIRSPAKQRIQGTLARLTLWDVAWRMGREHPWTGVGPNNFRAELPRYFTGIFEDGRKSWGTAHNLYLHQFAERGFLGLGALLALLGVFWARALRRARESPDAWNLWAFGTATAFLVFNLTEVALQIEIIWMLVFFIWIRAEKLHRAPRTR